MYFVEKAWQKKRRNGKTKYKNHFKKMFYNEKYIKFSKNDSTCELNELMLSWQIKRYIFLHETNNGYVYLYIFKLYF
jgi:hypothetical protein